MKVLIVGGVAGGATAAARTRRLNENAEIIMFEQGEYISFANCGLPYYIGGEISRKESLTLQTPQGFSSRYNIDVRVMSKVTEISRAEKSVTVKDFVSGHVYKESYDKLILSPGATPFIPPIPGCDMDRVFTLRNIPDTYRIRDYIGRHRPKSAVVAGGGYIGVEMAENLHRAGLEVSLVEMADQLIPPLDYDMACEVHRHIKSKGVNLLLGQRVNSIEKAENGLKVSLDDGFITADMVIMAVGIRPETEIAKNAGIALNERGFIITDEHMQTSDPSIFAVGDAVEITHFITGEKCSMALAGPANRQARVAADNICGISSVYEGGQGSSILRAFDMTAAVTGINEKTAKMSDIDYDKVFIYSPSHASYYPGAQNMSIKVLFEKAEGKIIGAQIVGFEGVDKRCDVLAAVIRMGASAHDLTNLELCYAPPYSSAKDPVNMAGYVIENILTGKAKIFHWHDVLSLPKDGSAILLDVREHGEFIRGSIDGFTNIPLGSLRSRLSELDRKKPVYVTCHSGFRGYIACRILTQNGFDAYNLSGGYRLFKSIYE